jgi:hypothetical protein
VGERVGGIELACACRLCAFASKQNESTSSGAAATASFAYWTASLVRPIASAARARLSAPSLLTPALAFEGNRGARRPPVLRARS